MPDTDLSLYAHLMRRAGFGARISELEEFADQGYDAVVDDLLHPERFPDIEMDVLERYYGTGNQGWSTKWWHRMLNSRRQLEEKMLLFWHYVFATGNSKSGHPPSSQAQIEMFRRHALSDFGTLLNELSKDPAMIFWLDNNENLKEEPNENWGRELLELFSMGVGNYTEEDVKGATQAFTGWTLSTPVPGAGSKYGGYDSQFVYMPNEHDNGNKQFLGETGPLNGGDIVEIVVRQPATANFLVRQLYTYFVADEPPVAGWNELPPQDPEAIQTLIDAYFESNGDVRHILHVLFTSDFFKEARFKRVKTPVELITGMLKLVGTFTFPETDFSQHTGAGGSMGQGLMNPLTVEGWPRGTGWIDGGTLNERINYAVNELDDPSKPGVKAVIDRLSSNGGSVSPDDFVDKCLAILDPAPVSEETRSGLLAYAESSGGDLDLEDPEVQKRTGARVARMLQLIVATREYQFG